MEITWPVWSCQPGCVPVLQVELTMLDTSTAWLTCIAHPTVSRAVMDIGIVTHLSPLTSVYTLSNLPLCPFPLVILVYPTLIHYSYLLPILLWFILPRVTHYLHLFPECVRFSFLFWKEPNIVLPNIPFGNATWPTHVWGYPRTSMNASNWNTQWIWTTGPQSHLAQYM